MEFKKYQHVERFGTDEVEGIDIGTCYIFPKIDGTNGSIWEGEDGNVSTGSRKRDLSEPGQDDNAGFREWVATQPQFKEFFKDYPYARLYGEWLVPHSLKTYNDSAWRQFYVFDVALNEVKIPCLASYEIYSKILDKYGIEFIPPVAIIKNPSYEKILACIEHNQYLIKEGSGIGEGIVIKNYEFRNKYGRQTWAKIVTAEFKTKHAKAMPQEIQDAITVEEKIAEKYVTQALCEKEHSKIVTECEGWRQQYIPRLLNTIFHCLVAEEAWNFVKEHKNPKIDFKRLKYLCDATVKRHMPMIFGV